VHAQTEDKGDDTKHSFCEELELVFRQLPTYYMKMFFEISTQM